MSQVSIFDANVYTSSRKCAEHKRRMFSCRRVVKHPTTASIKLLDRRVSDWIWLNTSSITSTVRDSGSIVCRSTTSLNIHKNARAPFPLGINVYDFPIGVSICFSTRNPIAVSRVYVLRVGGSHRGGIWILSRSLDIHVTFAAPAMLTQRSYTGPALSTSSTNILLSGGIQRHIAVVLPVPCTPMKRIECPSDRIWVDGSHEGIELSMNTLQHTLHEHIA